MATEQKTAPANKAEKPTAPAQTQPAVTEAPKRARIVKASDWDETTQTLAIEFANGAKREFAVGKCTNEIKVCFMLHGAQQKLSDTFAGAKGDVIAAIAGVDELWKRLSAPDATSDKSWGRTAGEGTGSGITIRALAEIFTKSLKRDVSVKEMTDRWATYSADKRKELAARPDVRLVIADIRKREAEAASKGKPQVALEF